MKNEPLLPEAPVEPALPGHRERPPPEGEGEDAKQRRGWAPSACQRCGACCAAYRVQFSVYELDEAGGSVPAAMTEPVNGSTCRMRGTGEVPIRCVALTGTLGQSVGCSIYHQRPAPCHELTEGSYACNKARARHGLPALEN